MFEDRSLFNLKDFYFIDQIDKGKYPLYLKAVDKKTAKLYLVSVYKLEENYLLFKTISNFVLLDHPSILKYRGFIIKPSTKEFQIDPTLLTTLSNFSNHDIFLSFTRYKENGDLLTATRDYLKNNGQNGQKLNPTIRSKIIFGIASAVKYLHSKSIAGIGLRLDNIYLNEQFEPKLTDLRIGSLNKHYDYIIDSLEKEDFFKCIYIAPEYHMGGDDIYIYNFDTYAFAFVIYFMFTNEIKFDKIHVISKFMLFRSIGKGMRPIKPDLMPNCYWELVCYCWSQNPFYRLSFEEIVEILKDDSFAIEEFGMKTDLDELHKYQKKVSF